MGIYELYETLDINKIDEFVANKQEENLHLEFKRVNEPKMDRDDRGNFAKALSGFANSDGGIIVWGVDARRNNDGIDCACDKLPITPLPLFLSRLNELTGSHVNPTVDGVIHRSIIVEADSGFVVTLIPSSDSTPHMAKGGEDRYFKRSGDSFIRMEHFEIEDMFGRRPKPRLRPNYRVIKGPGRSGEVLDFYVIISMENEGRGLARAPYLAIEVHGPCTISRFGLDGNGTEGLPRLASAGDSRRRCYGGTGDTVIHPGINHDVLALAGTLDPSAYGFGNLTIDYQIAAEGIQLKADRLLIDVNDLIAEIHKAWGE